MKLSKKQILGIIALLITLTSTSVAFAVIYMTKSVNITGGVSVVGAIEVYEDDGTTPLTSYDFPNFTGGQGLNQFMNFFINNTGNQPVYVYWNMSSASSTTSAYWTATSMGYSGWEGSPPPINKYGFYIATSWPSPYVYWASNEWTTPGVLYLDVGEGKELRIFHSYTGLVVTAELYSFTLNFYAEDA